MKKVHKKNWYDGWFYAAFIDTRYSLFRKEITQSLGSGQTVLDIGCGTGGLTLNLAEKSRYVLGIDISPRQIAIAQKRKNEMGLTNVDFIHASAGELSAFLDKSFDIAVIVFMIHEIRASDRLQVLTEVKKYCKKVIILDYVSNMPLNIWGIFIRLIEFLAGKEHFRNFRDYLSRGGMLPLLKEAEFTVLSHEVNKMRVFSLLTVTGPGEIIQDNSE